VSTNLLTQRRLAAFHVSEPLAELRDPAARGLQVFGGAL
jgi:hypothetical protein